MPGTHYDLRQKENAAYRLAEAGGQVTKAARLIAQLNAEGGAIPATTLSRWLKHDPEFRLLYKEQQVLWRENVRSARGQAETERMRRAMLGSHAEGLREDTDLLAQMRAKVKAILDGGEVKNAAMLNAFTAFVATLDKRHDRTWHVVGGDADTSRLLDALQDILRGRLGPEETAKLLKQVETRYLALTEEARAAAKQ